MFGVEGYVRFLIPETIARGIFDRAAMAVTLSPRSHASVSNSETHSIADLGLVAVLMVIMFLMIVASLRESNAGLISTG